MLDDLYFADNLKATQDAALRPPPVTKQAAGLSAWGLLTAAPRGAVAGGAQSIAFQSDVLGAFGQVLAGTGTVSAGGMFSTQSATERQQSDAAAQQIRTAGPDFSSAAGDDMRGFARFLAPDPETTHTAERLVFDFARVATKAVGYSVAGGGPGAGAVLAGADEGMTTADDLKQQGVDLGTRAAAGAVVGVATALGVALPVAGQTVKQTAGLVLAGGPLSFMAQQQAVRSILQAQDYSKLAEQYDPLDPVGLAVSTLIPAGFGAWGLRGNRARAAADAKAAEAQAARDFAAGPRPSDETPIAKAVREATQEQVDAARVMLNAEQRRAANPFKADDWRAYDAHEQALTRAIDQVAAGERVSVTDLLPPSPDTTAAHAVLAQIESLQAERAAILPDAGNLAERGAIRTARQELAQMEQQRPDTSEAAARALAKTLQEQEGIGYRPALSKAKDQIAGQMSDFMARLQRLQDTIDSNARAQQATQRVGELDKKIQELQQQLGPESKLAAFQRQTLRALAALPRETPAQPIQAHAAVDPPKPSSKPAAEPAQPAAGRPAEPAPAPGGAAARPAKSAETGLVEQAVATRAAEVQAADPHMLVQLDGMDSPQPLGELLAAIKAEADDMLADGELYQQAALCALAQGV